MIFRRIWQYGWLGTHNYQNYGYGNNAVMATLDVLRGFIANYDVIIIQIPDWCLKINLQELITRKLIFQIENFCFNSKTRFQ